VTRRVVALVALLAMTPVATAIIDEFVATSPIEAPYRVRLSFEAREPQRAALALLGQRNCVEEAAAGGSEACPSRPTGELYPTVGVRILDAVYHGEGPSDPSSGAEKASRDGTNATGYVLADVFRGSNTHRGTDGEAPEVILPGRAVLRAWHGYWSDLDDDGDADVDWNAWKPRPGNEFVGVRGEVASYIDPGSRPTLTSTWRPGDDAPDVFYRFDIYSQAYQVVGESAHNAHLAPIVFIDGSLLQTIVIVTVTDPVFAPDGLGRPYTPGATSLADVDRYPAAAPGSVSALYAATLAKPVNDLGSPSLGLCPGGCAVGPFAPPEPLAGPAGAAWSLGYARTLPEWDEASNSTAAGRRADYVARPTPWVDLRLLTSPGPGPASLAAGPLVGRDATGAPAPAPGFVALEVWYGLWHDLDGDGFIGDAGEDPYAAGARPSPDDYAQAAGEFIGRFPTATASTTAEVFAVKMVARPLATWGAGVGLFDREGLPICPGRTQRTNVADCRANGALHTGDKPLNLTALSSMTDRGRYRGGHTLFFPAGSPGFEVCVAAVYLRHGPIEDPRVDRVADCDVFGRWGEAL